MTIYLVPRFTFDTWEMIRCDGSESPEEEYMDYLGENGCDEFVDYVAWTLSDIALEDDDMIQAVPIDDGYINWLQGRQHSDVLLMRYMEYLVSSRQNAMVNALNREGLNVTMGLYLLPMTVAGKGKVNAMISDHTVYEMERYFEKLYGPEFNVYVPPFFIDGETMEDVDKLSMIYDMACSHFEGVDRLPDPGFRRMSANGRAALPVVLRETVKSGMMTGREIKDYMEECPGGRCPEGVRFPDDTVETILAGEFSRFVSAQTGLMLDFPNEDAFIEEPLPVPEPDPGEIFMPEGHTSIIECGTPDEAAERMESLFAHDEIPIVSVRYFHDDEPLISLSGDRSNWDLITARDDVDRAEICGYAGGVWKFLLTYFKNDSRLIYITKNAVDELTPEEESVLDILRKA